MKKKPDYSERSYVLARGDALGAIAMWVYRQAPGNHPRDLEKLLNKFNEKFTENAEVLFGDFYYYRIKRNDIKGFIKCLLDDIPEWQNLNLSQREVDNNVAVDDPSRPQFAFWGHNFGPSEYDNFIDLDAALRNITNTLLTELDDNFDFNWKYDHPTFKEKVRDKIHQVVWRIKSGHMYEVPSITSTTAFPDESESEEKPEA